MGAFYSFGIIFNNQNDAEKCKTVFATYNLQLSDSTKIESRVFVDECDYAINDLKQYSCSIFPIGLELPGLNPKLVQANYFCEIRNQLYAFLKNLKIEFNYAWFEFEAADIIKDENPLPEIKKDGIGEIHGGELNGYFAGVGDGKHSPKRDLDGFVISESLYESYELAIKEFEPFKSGYFWLPI